MFKFYDFKLNSEGLIPVITQDYSKGEVLMLAYMNEEAYNKTIETGQVHYYSRSRKELWHKGATSGHFQNVKEITVDCDRDTLLIKVEQIGKACHTGEYSCFSKGKYIDNINEEGEEGEKSNRACINRNKSEILEELYKIVLDRKANPKEGSYTNYLFEKGLDKILKKVGEEASEVIIASKNLNKDEIRYEIADLYYHLFVLMAETGVVPDDIYDELKKRR